MENLREYPGGNPLEIIKKNEKLPEKGIIFVLEPQPGKYKSEAVCNVMFYDETLKILNIMEKKDGGHVTVHARGVQISFAFQNLENPDSIREPYNRQAGYLPISFQNLGVVNLKNNHRVLVEETLSDPGWNYELPNWADSFSRIFEEDKIEELKFTMIKLFNEKLAIAKEDAEVVAKTIIDKFI